MEQVRRGDDAGVVAHRRRHLVLLLQLHGALLGHLLRDNEEISRNLQSVLMCTDCFLLLLGHVQRPLLCRLYLVFSD